MNLGENIYRLRTERNLSQGALAEALEVSRQSVRKWENNSATPELDKLMKMSALFGVTLDELVSGKESESGSPQKETPQKEVAAIPLISVRKITGVLLLICGILCFWVPTFLGSFLVGFLFGVPLAVIGSILAFSECDWLFRICWLLCGLFIPMLSLFGYNFVRFDISSRFTLISLGILALLIIWTVLKARRNQLSKGSKCIIAVSTILFVLSVAMFNFLFAAPPLERASALFRDFL